MAADCRRGRGCDASPGMSPCAGVRAGRPLKVPGPRSLPRCGKECEVHHRFSGQAYACARCGVPWLDTTSDFLNISIHGLDGNQKVSAGVSPGRSYIRYDLRYDVRMSAAEPLLSGSVGAIPLRTAAVLDAIKRAILAGELRPGQSLVEAELAQRLGVSKTPVREALKTLAGAGLVTMSPYRGATVRAIDVGTARAIYDMRLLLEPEAVRRAVLRAAGQTDPGSAAGGPVAGDPAGLAAARAALDRADA